MKHKKDKSLAAYVPAGSEIPERGGLIEHFVEYLYPGSLFPEEAARKIGNHWDLTDALKHLEPAVFCFSFFDIQVRRGTLEDGEAITDRRRINCSLRFYPDATHKGHAETRIFTLAEVRAMGKEFSTVANNMEANDWPRVVRTRRSNWQPFVEGDKLVETSTARITDEKLALQNDPNKKDLLPWPSSK